MTTLWTLTTPPLETNRSRAPKPSATWSHKSWRGGESKRSVRARRAPVTAWPEELRRVR